MLYDNLEIGVEDLPDLTHAEFKSHPKGYLRLRLAYKLLFFSVLLALLFIPLIAGDYSFFYLLLGVWSVSLLLSIIIEMKSFGFRGYLLRTHDVSYRKGWIFSEHITIPYNRIQHSEVSQGSAERYMKLSTLKVYTAGGSGADISIQGLDPEEAEKMREWITEKTSLHV